MSKVCKFFVKGNCRDGEKCRFSHEKDICRNHFFDKCTVTDCRFKHTAKLDEKKEGNRDGNRGERRKVKNTETFEPSHIPADMRIMLANPKSDVYQNKIYSRDVIIAPNLFGELNNITIYNKLLDEVDAIGKDNIWKLWHGDTHLIADDKHTCSCMSCLRGATRHDHANWKAKCPTMTMITDKLAKYFKMDVKASRLNWYRDLKEWKPFHHDAAAVDPKKAATQNLTIGVSFGATRDVSFEHAKTKTRTTIPLEDGMTYGFAKDVNIIWRHGIPQLSDKEIEEIGGGEDEDQGRISIIIWGYSEIIDI